MAATNVETKELQLPKKLIVLCDGTWKNSDFGWEDGGLFTPGRPQVPSNVTRISRAIKPETKKLQPQIVYYQAGVGSSSWSAADHFLGGGLAYGISQNIREAYGFLAHNFMAAKDGTKDEIFLLGFSRGAFTARSVGGMISSIGLLEKEAMQYFYYIFEDFENAGKAHYQVKLKDAIPSFKIKADSKDLKLYLAEYKRELIKLKLTREVPIQAILVFDTVGTLGLPLHPWAQAVGLPSAIHGYRFFDTGISNHVKYAFQALALDERRSAFNATVWEKEEDNDTTKLRQVWFPGAHSNIGGGYEESSQADLTIAWTVDQLSPFIDFNEEYIIKQFEKNRETHFALAKQDADAKKPFWQWGHGTVYNSNTFPTRLGGSIDRSPGRYQKLIYDTGKPDTKNPKLLRDTNEYIHASVRARKDHGGLDAWGKPYGTPPALKGWDLNVENDQSGNEVASWTCSLKEDLAYGRVMQEAPMGRMERKLLGYDKVMEEHFKALRS